MKKALSLALALVMCLGLTIPAFAASDSTFTSAPGEPVNITFDGFLRTEYVNSGDAGDEDSFFAVLVVKDGSSVYVGSNEYTAQYIVSMNTYGYSPETGVFWLDSGTIGGGGDMSTITLTATPSEDEFFYMVLIPGFGQQSYCWMCESNFAKVAAKHKGVPDSGSEIFGTAGPDKSAQPTTPTEPEQPTTPTVTVENIPASGTAKASTQTVTVDGKTVEFQMYALVDANGNGTNYIKLRDMAQVLNGTKAQFSVGYDGTISVTSGEAYASTGSEMTTPFSGDRSYTGGAQSIKVNGSAIDMTAITLLDDAGGGYNYFKLRDLGAALGFNVGWSAENGVFIESDKPYAG